MNLEQAIKELYAEEINCGINSFWDGGFTAFIGDEMNGIKVEKTFDVAELDKVGAWLISEAKSIYANYPTRDRDNT